MSIIATNHRAELAEIVRHTGNISGLGKKFKQAVIDNTFESIKVNKEDILSVDGPTFKQMVNDTFGPSDYTPDKARILTWTNRKVLEYGIHIRQLKGYSANFNAGEYAISNKPYFYKKGGRRIITDSEVYIQKIDSPTTEYDIEGKYVYLSHQPNTGIFLPDDQQAVKLYLNHLRRIKDWDTFYKIKHEWLDLRSVYASTVHKSQGSEYEKVFIDLSDIGRCTISSDAARLLYVGITRATKQVILYGSLPERYGGTPQE
jgi:hypothetical protein